MLRGLLTLCILLCSSLTWAQRNVPSDMNVAVLKRVEFPYLTLSRSGFSWINLLTFGLLDGNRATVQVSRFVKIRDENDRFMVLGRLTTIRAGKIIAIRQNGAGLVEEIWILTEQEAQAAERLQEDSE